jgi:hypothetical protein
LRENSYGDTLALESIGSSCDLPSGYRILHS